MFLSQGFPSQEDGGGPWLPFCRTSCYTMLPLWGQQLVSLKRRVGRHRGGVGTGWAVALPWLRAAVSGVRCMRHCFLFIDGGNVGTESSAPATYSVCLPPPDLLQRRPGAGRGRQGLLTKSSCFSAQLRSAWGPLVPRWGRTRRARAPLPEPLAARTHSWFSSALTLPGAGWELSRESPGAPSPRERGWALSAGELPVGPAGRAVSVSPHARL